MADLIINKILIIKGILAEKCGLHPDLYDELSDLLNDIAIIYDAKICAMDKTTNENGALPIPCVMLSLPDIRNKLSPFKNLIAMLNNGLMKGRIEVHPLIQKEIEQCKKSIAYLSNNEA